MKVGSLIASVAIVLAHIVPAVAQEAKVEIAAGQHRSAAQSVPEGTAVRLMVLRELTSRTAKSGDRFKLRVDEAIAVNGRTLVPIGATVWGEITTVEKNGALGKGGSLAARLLYIQLEDGNVPLTGDLRNKSSGNGTALGVAVLSFGLFGLLNAGDSGRLKAGDIFTAYTASAPLYSGQVIQVPSD
jgi:hypothetical protein